MDYYNQKKVMFIFFVNSYDRHIVKGLFMDFKGKNILFFPLNFPKEMLENFDYSKVCLLNSYSLNDIHFSEYQFQR